MNQYRDLTQQWINEAKPKKGSIRFLNYVITQEGERFDYTNSILSISTDDDVKIGTWFKNNIWGNCRFQPSIDAPQGKRSADLRLFGNCKLVRQQTIEIKIVSSVRVDGLAKRFKQAKSQSSNVLLDVTNYPYEMAVVKSEVRKYFLNHNWVDLVAVKKDNDLQFVWQKV